GPSELDAAAQRVEQDPHLDAMARAVDERIDEAVREASRPEDVGLQVHAPARSRDRRQHRREDLLPVLEQHDAVSADHDRIGEGMSRGQECRVPDVEPVGQGVIHLAGAGEHGETDGEADRDGEHGQIGLDRDSVHSGFPRPPRPLLTHPPKNPPVTTTFRPATRRPFRGPRRRATLALAAALVASCSCSYIFSEKRTVYEYDPAYGVDSPEFRRSLDALGAELSPRNRAEVLVNGDATFASMLGAIRDARESVNLEMYIFSQGVIGSEFSRALAERARAGVEVRVLV